MGAVVADPASTPLARLFAMAYRHLIDDLHERLRERGWTDVRPAYGFALLAAREQPVTTTALATLMGMTKQAGSKLAASMVADGYLAEAPGAPDGRVRPLKLTRKGTRLLAAVEAIYAELEAEWSDAIGDRALRQLRSTLTRAITTFHTGQLPALRPVW